MFVFFSVLAFAFVFVFGSRVREVSATRVELRWAAGGVPVPVHGRDLQTTRRPQPRERRQEWRPGSHPTTHGNAAAHTVIP